MVSVKIYVVKGNISTKEPVIINIDSICRIESAGNDIHGNTMAYNVFLNNTSVIVAAEDMQPIWDAIGTKL